MCDPLLVDWPWGPMASLLRDKDIQEKLPSRKTNLRKIIDSTVVTLNAPIFYWDIKRIVLNIIEDIRKGKPENIKHYIRSGGSFPLSALLNFRKLLNKTKPKIKEVQCPVLLLKPFKMIR
jgi:hypothetical protein